MRKLIMTPGPTYVREDVRRAMSMEITNPDVDMEFYEFYKELCEKIQKLLYTKNEVLIMAGEGILGLEAACASLVEEGDKVLVIENGIFGEGFGDFVKIYGGEVEYFHGDRRKGLELDKLENFLKDNHDFKVATIVHCETPSGITNPIKEVCELLNKYNIISVVDSVSSMMGEELKVDEWGIDIALGGSQKCISAPPGLTILTVSSRAKEAIKNRKTPVRSFYGNIGAWENWYENKWFPYTQPISDLYALDKAIDNIIEDENIILRHKKLGSAFRDAISTCGLELFTENYHSNTVSTVLVPEGVKYQDIYNKMYNEEDIIIAGGFDFLKDKIFRVGHMGENCYEEKLYLTLKALNKVLSDLGVELKGKLHSEFIKNIELS